jgi:hypothetical protein
MTISAIEFDAGWEVGNAASRMVNHIEAVLNYTG